MGVCARQVYGFGYSEEFIGEFMRKTGARPQIATKYAPLPWRFTSGSVVDACKYALKPSPQGTKIPGAVLAANVPCPPPCPLLA